MTAGPTRARRPTAAQQLALDLPVSLPAIAIEPEWKAQQRLWGHSFHPMCSYLASFPAALAHAFIARYSRPGDVVLDPFSGRGTTPLQACAEGRLGVGNDLNPFAHLLTASKVEPATRGGALTRLTQLRLGWNADAPGWARLARRVAGDPAATLVPAAGSHGGPDGGTEPVPVEVVLAFHPDTLGQLLFVRSELRLEDRTDRFLAAAITGILHGKSASYLSELMPNTFSMAPRYVREFATRTSFASPRRDVFDGLASLYILSALFGLFQGGIVPAYAVIIREFFPPEEAGVRVGTVLMATVFGMALGGWMSGVIFDLTGSYHAAFINGILWNLLNVGIAVGLLRRSGRPMEEVRL